MKSHFKILGIIGRVKHQKVKEALHSLIILMQSLGQNFIIEADTAQSLGLAHLPTLSKEALSKNVDLIIVVGGDGSFLSAAHAMVSEQTPLLGINRGSLGFLTDISPTELNKIKAILEGQYSIEKRFILSAKIEWNGKILGESHAINEVALIPNCIPHMMEFEIWVDTQFICSQSSDGLITATPTGSTAYALSAGGPILHPSLNVMVLVPMFPHSLNNRPIVIDADNTVCVRVSINNIRAPRVSFDGQNFMDAPPGSMITISKHEGSLHLVHPLDYNYYETLRSKLHWGRKLTSEE
jgi:NAD+ kinase